MNNSPHNSADTAPKGSFAPATQRKPLRILLVDDSRHDYAAFQRAFDKSDITAKITHEPSGEPALQRLIGDSAQFDLVVTDYRLGGMNGLELCREILRLEIPIALVILTGSGSEDLAVEALKAGVDDYLIKDPDQGYFQLLPVVLPEAVRRRNDRMVRKLAEEALASGEARLFQILDSVGDGAWDWNVKTGRLHMSPRYWQILGYQTDGLAASYWTWLDLLHPDDRDLLVARIQRHIDNAEESFAEEFRMRTPDGRYRWVISKAALAEHTPEGRPLRCVGIVQDITDSRLAETKYKRLLSKLKARNRELERFGRIINSHFSPPLMSIETFIAELASLMDEVRRLLELDTIGAEQKQQLTTLLKTGAGSDIGYIQTAVRDMRRLLDGLGELIAADHRPLQVEPVDMDRLIADVRSALTEVLEDTRAELHTDSLPPCLSDYGWTKQIFIHLLSNALRNLDPDRPGRVAITAAFEDEMVVYCLEDNGVGIDPARQKNLFDLLPPAPDTGRGLGLSIVARIVDRLDGQIRVDSQLGRGSRFYVSLPAIPAHLQTAKPVEQDDSIQS